MMEASGGWRASVAPGTETGMGAEAGAGPTQEDSVQRVLAFQTASSDSSLVLKQQQIKVFVAHKLI